MVLQLILNGIGYLILFGFFAIFFVNFIRKKWFNIKFNKATSILKSLGFNNTTFNKYELAIASQIIEPSNIDITFEDIAGLKNIVELVNSNVIMPLMTFNLLNSNSWYFQPPKGVLLSGPSGCGKTMIAKATAKHANARFINLEIPSLTDKWYGESQKLSLAVFTLAEKLKPCIIFIDEIDSFLRSRDRHDHEVTAMMKAQFMVKWDGLLSKNKNCGIVILGATNRPEDVDPAISRRMPLKINIPLPNLNQRISILNMFLVNEVISDDVDTIEIAEKTDGFSSSDLKEVCRQALSRPMKEKAQEIIQLMAISCYNKNESLNNLISNLRIVNINDFVNAINLVDSEVDKTKKTDINCVTKNLHNCKY